MSEQSKKRWSPLIPATVCIFIVSMSAFYIFHTAQSDIQSMLNMPPTPHTPPKLGGLSFSQKSWVVLKFEWEEENALGEMTGTHSAYWGLREFNQVNVP